MTPERYQQIDQIFQAALELNPEQLPAFLDEACSGDERLRKEVESLITSERGGLSFIDFQQEARAASALNHPNIITIHEIGQVDNRHFIATEFVDGETLRQRMRRGPLSLHEALDITIQVCGALVAAHGAGIVHRDIKPENIMLRRDGYVKVLDFGLAKLTEEHERSIEVGKDQRVDLSSGLVMGTVRYMSPEQTQGRAVDRRSDIFSLGVVLYEMVTGRPPFEGKTSSDLVSAITSDKPLPLKHHSPNASNELQQITDKALHKEREARYQNADDMLRDLLKLKEKSTARGVAYLTDKIKQHRIGAGLALVLLVIGLAVTLLELIRFFKGRHVPFQQTRVTKLTNFDDAWQPAISPDGKFVAYVKGTSTTGAGKNSLWLKTIGTTNERPLVPATDGFITYARFLDGEHVAYQTSAAFVVSTSGGAPTKLPTKGVVLSPDGRRVAYLDSRMPEGKTMLVVANSDGTDMRDITTRQAPNYYWADIRASWSPDGKLIACVGQNGNESFPHVFVINLETHAEIPLTGQRWTSMRGVAWLPDMQGLLAVASEETSSTLQIWEIFYPGGEARRITMPDRSMLLISAVVRSMAMRGSPGRQTGKESSICQRRVGMLTFGR